MTSIPAQPMQDLPTRAIAAQLPAVPQPRWRESLITTILGGIVLAWMTLPAFDAYFLGEDFIYLGQYRAAGDRFWQAVFSPTDGIFFRPVLCGVNLLWQAVLPLEAGAHHLRNMASSMLCILLLHRVLLRLTTSALSRAIAMALFVASKIHLTAIGYINVNDSIVSLTCILATVLFFLRYDQSRRGIDYAAGVVFCILAIFTKDYGLVIVGIVAAMVVCTMRSPGEWRGAAREWALRLTPLPLAVGIYLFARSAIVLTLPTTNPVYSPKLFWDLTLHKLVIFLSALGNLSVATLPLDLSTSGARGASTWLASLDGNRGFWTEDVTEWFLFSVFILLIVLTLVAGRRAGWKLVFPLVWIAGYFAPTLLTRNLQMYYMYEPMAGAVVLLAICLDAARPWLKAVWLPMVLFIGINGYLSNQRSLYHWQFAARGTRQFEKPLVESYRGKPLDSVTFLTRSPEHWNWALMAGMKGPMVPELLERPRLRVSFANYQSLRSTLARRGPNDLIVDIDNGIIPHERDIQQAPPVLRRVVPEAVVAGVGCNVQPDGQSAIAIEAQNASPATIVVLEGRELVTAIGNPAYLTALIPADMLAAERVLKVHLDNGVSQSNALEFHVGTPEEVTRRLQAAEKTIQQPADRPLFLIALHPAKAIAGRGFGVQADGRWAIGVQTRNALPGTVIYMNESPLETTYGSPEFLTAFVKPELVIRPATYAVKLRYGQSWSNELEFRVLAP